MKCENCGQEFTEEFCHNCGWSPDGVDSNPEVTHPNDTQKENSSAKACKWIAGIYMVIMVFGSIVLAAYAADSYRYSGVYAWGIFLGVALGGLFTGMLLWGLGEVIQLLHEVSNMLKNIHIRNERDV